MKWKMFLRTNGRFSIGHLCNEKNECACGWKYEPEEVVKVHECEVKPHFACSNCENGIIDNEEVRMANCI
ncbi:MAG: hypothetical protein GY928_32145 [Colwellia sp.]|nr:hypothetical protein [Colwellia sp.]